MIVRGLWLGGVLEQQQRGVVVGGGEGGLLFAREEVAVFLLVTRAFSTTRCPTNVAFDRFSGQYCLC